MKRSNLKRKTKLRFASKKRAVQLKEYSKVRKAYLELVPICQACIHIGEGIRRPATEIHHKSGRRGEMLNDTSAFLAICRPCHNFIHSHPATARYYGLLHVS